MRFSVADISGLPGHSATVTFQARSIFISNYLRTTEIVIILNLKVNRQSIIKFAMFIGLAFSLVLPTSLVHAEGETPLPMTDIFPEVEPESSVDPEVVVDDVLLPAIINAAKAASNVLRILDFIGRSG